MKYGVIDVGSNSVRLMLAENERTLWKKTEITRLGEGISLEPVLSRAAIARTVDAVVKFKEIASKNQAAKIYVFATAAVRSAVNGSEFTAAVKAATGLVVDVVSGEEEASLGLIGALGSADGGVIDIGGASTEITVQKGGRTIYAHSLDLGIVRIFDLCGQNKDKISALIDCKLSEYGKIPQSVFYAVGGTATSLAAIDEELDPYDPRRVDGHVIEAATLRALAERLIALSCEERRRLKGLQPQRADVIAGGAMLLAAIAERFGIAEIIVSESDNLEGYLRKKLEGAL